MSISKPAVEADSHHSARRALVREKHVRQQHSTTAAQLNNALAREEALLREKSDLLRRHEMMAQEFEHRLFNSLQLIVSLLWLQSRAASTPEAATQLSIAADRVAALGRVHRQLHVLDHQERVEFKQYIHHLCEDLSGLLFQDGAKRAIAVEGVDVEIPTALGIPLGFIINELITNSAKYAKGTITVRLGTASANNHWLSVSDDGPGLPAEFDPVGGRGLGMKIIQALVRQIGGELHIARANQDRGACFTVTFNAQGLEPPPALSSCTGLRPP
jgi:two-component system, sensor histidine kinase PdtaS